MSVHTSNTDTNNNGGITMKSSILALLVALVLVASATAAAGPSFTATLLRYEPVPANPGDTINVWIQIQNTGDSTSQNTLLTFEDSYPFKPLGSQAQGVSIGTLAAGDEYTVKVPVLVDRNAPAGDLDLRFAITQGNALSAQRFTLTIPIEASGASLAINSITTTPLELTPGSEGTIGIIVENIEDSLLRDLAVTLDLDGSVFAPIGSTNQQKIARLDGSELHTFRFRILTEPNAASSVYRIPVAFNYTQSDGTHQSQQQVIGLVVKADPELAVVVDQTNLYKGEGEGTVLVRLINKGLSQIKFAQADLLPADGYTIGGSSAVAYVGNIDSDDYETAEYTIEPSADSFTLKLKVTYRDALNNPYEELLDVPVSVQPSQKGNSLWPIYVLVLVVVLVGVWIWRRNTKSKR